MILNGIKITDLHRRFYKDLYARRKKGSYIGYNKTNKTYLKTLNELVELGYLRFLHESSEQQVAKHSKKVYNVIWCYYESTGKKIPSRKFPTKPIKELYDEDDIYFKLIHRPNCNINDSKKRYYFEENVTVDGNEAKVYISSHRNYFLLYNERVYMFDFNTRMVGNRYWTLPEKNRDRIFKLREILDIKE